MVAGWGLSSPAWAAISEPSADGDEATHEAIHEDGYERLLEDVFGATVVYPQEKGEIQLTLEPSYVRRRADHLGVITYDVEIGATDWLQFELAWTAPVIRGVGGGSTTLGVGGIELGTQLTWMRMRGSPFSGAIAFEATVPVGRESIAIESDEGAVVYEPFITFAVDPPSGRAQVFTNMGLELSAAEEPRPFLNAGVLGAAAFTRPYVVVSCSPGEAYVVPSMGFVLPAGWQLVAGVAVGLSRRSDPIGVGLLLVYEFNPLERRRQ